MALTRRYFTDLAASYREARPHGPEDTTAFAVWMHMVTITANSFAIQHSMFKHSKFYEACGMPQEAIDRAVR